MQSINVFLTVGKRNKRTTLSNTACRVDGLAINERRQWMLSASCQTTWFSVWRLTTDDEGSSLQQTIIISTLRRIYRSVVLNVSTVASSLSYSLTGGCHTQPT